MTLGPPPRGPLPCRDRIVAGSSRGGRSCDTRRLRGRLVVFQDTLYAVENLAPVWAVAAVKQADHRRRTANAEREFELRQPCSLPALPKIADVATSIHRLMMVPESAQRHKEKSEPNFLPGPELVAYIRRHARIHGRSHLNFGLTDGGSDDKSQTWHALAPRLDGLIVLEPIASRTFTFGVVGEPLGDVLPWRVALALELTSTSALDLALGQLTHDDKATWRRLSFAVLRDIHGISTNALTTAVTGRLDRSTTREDCRLARPKLSRTGVWPWYCFGPSGEPPGDWYSHANACPEAFLALSRWAASKTRLSDLSAPIRRSA